MTLSNPMVYKKMKMNSESVDDIAIVENVKSEEETEETKKPQPQRRRHSGKKKRKKKLGFTNKLAIWLVVLLGIGLLGGFLLAILSIKYAYTGPLMCWTVVFTPIGTAISIVLGKIVDKSRDENTGGNGDGIKFAQAKANNFMDMDEMEMMVPEDGMVDDGMMDSPSI